MSECALLFDCQYCGICDGCVLVFFFFQAEDGIRDLVRSRGLGDVYKRQIRAIDSTVGTVQVGFVTLVAGDFNLGIGIGQLSTCLLYTSDAADERSSVDLGGRRIIKKKTNNRADKRVMSEQKMRHNTRYRMRSI